MFSPFKALFALSIKSNQVCNSLRYSQLLFRLLAPKYQDKTKFSEKERTKLKQLVKPPNRLPYHRSSIWLFPSRSTDFKVFIPKSEIVISNKAAMAVTITFIFTTFQQK